MGCERCFPCKAAPGVISRIPLAHAPCTCPLHPSPSLAQNVKPRVCMQTEAAGELEKMSMKLAGQLDAARERKHRQEEAANQHRQEAKRLGALELEAQQEGTLLQRAGKLKEAMEAAARAERFKRNAILHETATAAAEKEVCAHLASVSRACVSRATCVSRAP